MTKFTLHRHAMIGFQPDQLETRSRFMRDDDTPLKAFTSSFAWNLCNRCARDGNRICLLNNRENWFSECIQRGMEFRYFPILPDECEELWKGCCQAFSWWLNLSWSFFSFLPYLCHSSFSYLTTVNEPKTKRILKILFTKLTWFTSAMHRS